MSACRNAHWCFHQGLNATYGTTGIPLGNDVN